MSLRGLHNHLNLRLSQNSPHNHLPISMILVSLMLLRFFYSPSCLMLELSLQISWYLSSKSPILPQSHHLRSSPRLGLQLHVRGLIKLRLKPPLLPGSLHTYRHRSHRNYRLVEDKVSQQMTALHLHLRHLDYFLKSYLLAPFSLYTIEAFLRRIVA